MSLTGLNLKDFTPYNSQFDYVKKTAEQLIKDFEIFGYEITFTGAKETAYAELTNQVKAIIKELITNDYKRLLSLMYKIDLSEERVAIIINNNNKEDMLLELTHSILERELKKVVIKEYFKNQENDG